MCLGIGKGLDGIEAYDWSFLVPSGVSVFPSEFSCAGRALFFRSDLRELVYNAYISQITNTSAIQFWT